MSRSLNVGVIGVGHLGQHHARLYAQFPETRLVGVFDTDPSRAAAVADRYGTKVFADLPTLLANVEAVSVAVPTSVHHPVVKSCLLAGVHVLVEKPITAGPSEAADLVEVAKHRQRILQVGHSERFNPAVLAVRPHLGKPGFVECHRLSPFGERGTDVDVVLDLMIHDLDMLLSFKPGPVEEIRAAGIPVLSSRIDIANARIAFAGGCVANLTASRVSTTRLRKLRLFQQDAYITVDYHARQSVIVRRRVRSDGKPEIYGESVPVVDEEPLKLQLVSFLKAVRAGTPPVVSGEDGAAALNLAFQVLQAIEAFIDRHRD